MPLAFVGMVVVRTRLALQKSATFVVNSGALAVGTLSTAALGFAYWWLAARTLPPEAIGQASALLSVMGLIGLLGEAGLGTLLIGEIPRHQDRAPGLVAAAAGIGVALTLVISVLFVIGEACLLRGTGPINGWFEAVLFVVGGGLTGLTMLGGSALLGNLRGVGRMIHSVLFSVIKLALIAVAVAASGASARTIILTWVGGLLVSWIAYDLLSEGGARRLVGPPDFALLGTLRRKIFHHYALDVTMQATGIIMPYLVLVLLSPTVNAAFALLWMLVTVASVVPMVLATTLFPVVRSNPKQSKHDMLMSLTISLLFSVVCACVVFVFSRELLALFNPTYPEIAGTSLRFLGFSLLGSTLKFHLCALARLGDWMRKASIWFAVGGLLELCFAVAGAKLDGLQGLVLGWTLAVSIEGACAALVLGLATKLVSAPVPASQGPPPLPLRT